MADKTVEFQPFPGQSFSITGSESDAGIVGELERSGGFYQRDLAELLQQRLVPEAVVVDVGAHIGVVTVLLAGLCPKGHVYAFEPVAENHAHLTANVAANGLGNVTVERTALFAIDGEILLEYDAAYPGGSHVGAGGEKVPARRLDSWAHGVALGRLDLVKLDVEGVELDVLDGAAETLRRFRPLLVVECNPVALPRFGGAGYAGLLRRLRGLYPVVGVIGPAGRVLPVASAEHLRMMLAERGVIDLVGLPGSSSRGRMRARARAVADLIRRSVTRRRGQPPEHNFVIDPGGISFRPAITALAGRPGETVEFDVEIRNRSRSWLSSEFPHPVNLSYRWLDAEGRPTGTEGARRNFSGMLAPGRSTTMRLGVTLPAPGHHTLALTLVQEHFAWLDDMDPACGARLPVTVADEA